MNDETDRLERDFDEAFAPWADALNVSVPEAAVLRAKDSIHQALNEGWLADQPEPVPSGELVQQVKTAVRRELAIGGAPSVWRRAAGVLAAAAMIAIGVGVTSITRTWTVGRPGGLVEASNDARVERFVAVADEVFGDDPLTAEIYEDLDAIEATLTDWDTTASGGAGVFSEIVDDIDELLETGETDQNLSWWPRGFQGAIG